VSTASEDPPSSARPERLPLRPTGSSRVADPAGALTAADLSAVEAASKDTERRTGDEIWVLVERGRSASPQALAERARRVFEAWALEPRPPQATVLVAVDMALGRAVVETGQGVEGPFTALEAQGMAELAAPALARGDGSGALGTLIAAVGRAAEATRERRRPPEDDQDAAPRGSDQPSSNGLFTRLGAFVAGGIVLLLALRQRRRNQARPSTPAPTRERPKYLGPPRIDR